MASHIRKINGNSGERREQIKFTRSDLLWVGRATDPVTHDIYDLPLQIGDGVLVGPTILDMLHRIERNTINDGDEQLVGFWSVRAAVTLFPSRAERTKAKQKAKNLGRHSKSRVDHPFVPKLASGGSHDNMAQAIEGFVRVRKLTTVSIGEYAYRLAAKAFGSVAAARSRFCRVGRERWEADLSNSVKIWQIVINNPEGQTIEDEELFSLRPSLSVSQDVERIVTREAFIILGIDPDLDISSPRGRPKKAPGDEGEIISLKLVEQDNDLIAVGSFKTAYRGIEAGTLLSAVPDLKLVAILGALRLEGLETDADLLEAYLDAASPCWRDEAAEQAVGGDATSTPSFDPFEVLGISKGATMEEVKKAKNNMMKLVHPDVNMSIDGTWRPSSIYATLINDAYNQIKSERGAL